MKTIARRRMTAIEFADYCVDPKLIEIEALQAAVRMATDSQGGSSPRQEDVSTVMGWIPDMLTARIEDLQNCLSDALYEIKNGRKPATAREYPFADDDAIDEPRHK